MRNPRLAAAAIHAFLAVAAGAWAAHGLEKIVPSAKHVAWFETGSRYQMYHALALFGLALAGTSGRLPRLAGHAMQLGIVLFSGSLYAMALTDVRVLGAITPLGGAGFLIGWGLLAAYAFGCCSASENETIEDRTADGDGA